MLISLSSGVTMNKNVLRNEDAFTVIELMVVAFIVGVLATISIPVFTAHKKGAIKIALVADVRNAASEMEKAEVFSKTGFKSSLPDDYVASETNTVEVMVEQSSSTYYCLKGTNAIFDDMFVYYNSTTRMLITEGTQDTSQCGAVSAKEDEPYDPNKDKNPGGVAGETVYASPSPSTPSNTGTPSPGGATPSPSAPSSPGNASPDETSPTPTDEVSSGNSVAPPYGYDDSKRTKYDICHNGNMISPALSGILNGHNDHGDDIIPPIPGAFFPGLNWNEVGAGIWYAGCEKEINKEKPVKPVNGKPVTPKAPAPPGYNDPNAVKFPICHNGNKISPSLSGVVHGHAGHSDDIIPPITDYLPAGVNWDDKGASIWHDDCKGQAY